MHLYYSHDVQKIVKMLMALSVNGVIGLIQHNPLTIIVPMRRLPDMFAEQKQQVDSKNSVRLPHFSLRISIGNCIIKTVSKLEWVLYS